MPTTAFKTFSGGMLMPIKGPAHPQRDAIRLKPSTTFPAYTIVGPVTGQAYYGPYASGNVDGTQNATHILMYACITDASGNVSKGDVAGGNEWAISELTAPAYRGGYFQCEDIANLDAGLFTAKRAIQEVGIITAGRFIFVGA